jgi:hypothetical protein
VTRLLSLSSWMYARLIFFYSEDLRRDFGMDMALVFADDVAAAWRDKRAVGVIRVWWCALSEVLTIALPSQRANPCFLVPAISFAVTATMQVAELFFALHQPSAVGVHRPLLSQAIRTMVLWPSLANALIALVVSLISTCRSITSLRLVSPPCEVQEGL